MVLFAICLVLMLVAPFLVAILPISESTVYRSVPLKYANYRFVGERIAEGGPVDVLFIGSSDAWTAFDAPLLTEELSTRLGRPATVYNFGTNWFGAESYFVRLEDALTSLKPKLVVVPDSDAGYTFPHELARFVWRADSGSDIEGLSVVERLTLHGTATIGAPRMLAVTASGMADRPIAPEWQATVDTYENTLGYNGEKHGWLSHWDPDRDNRQPYEEREHQPRSFSLDEISFVGISDERFQDRDYDYSTYQTAFIKQMAELTQQSGATFVTVSIPTHFKQKVLEKAVIRPLFDNEPRTWRHIGISMAQLFDGLTYDQTVRFYSNESHLNASGARVFSRALAPALLQVMADAE